MTKGRWLLVFLFASVLFFFLELSFGSVSIPFSEVFHILLSGSHENESWKVIVLNSRWPRAIAALLAGALLSVSGLLLQGMFRNPLAGPHILGVSSGASLGVAITVFGAQLLGLKFLTSMNSVIVIASFAGSLLVILALFLLSLRIKDVLTLLIFGILISGISMAIVGILQYMSDATQLKAFVIWTLGSMDGVSRSQAQLMAVLGLPVLLLIIPLLRNLNLMLSGSYYAQSMGVNVKRNNLYIMLIAGWLTAVITAFCGPIGFVGVIVPHLARLLMKTSDHRFLFPGSVLIGVSIMLLSDFVSHLPGSQHLLPINSITSLIGIPFIFWLLWNRRLISRI
jgi:iron complex transport system permease protein